MTVVVLMGLSEFGWKSELKVGSMLRRRPRFGGALVALTQGR
jgi:hypothetical protein